MLRSIPVSCTVLPMFDFCKDELSRLFLQTD